MGDSAADDQAEAADESNRISRERLKLDALNSALNAESQVMDLNTAIDQYKIDIRDYTSQVDSLDQFLANYQNLVDIQDLQQQQEQTAFENAGKESYENYLNALGYADAVAGMRGTVGAGTSQAAVTGKLDEQLVAFAGADRSLEGIDGMYGMQRDLMGRQQAQQDMELQDQQTSAIENQKILQESIEMLTGSISTAQTNRDTAQKAAEKLRKQAGY